MTDSKNSDYIRLEKNIKNINTKTSFNVEMNKEVIKCLNELLEIGSSIKTYTIINCITTAVVILILCFLFS